MQYLLFRTRLDGRRKPISKKRLYRRRLRNDVYPQTTPLEILDRFSLPVSAKNFGQSLQRNPMIGFVSNRSCPIMPDLGGARDAGGKATRPVPWLFLARTVVISCQVLWVLRWHLLVSAACRNRL
jgi:hypothetical protein